MEDLSFSFSGRDSTGRTAGAAIAPPAVNADLMTSREIHALIQEGYEDALAGNLYDASAAFQEFRKKHS